MFGPHPILGNLGTRRLAARRAAVLAFALLLGVLAATALAQSTPGAGLGQTATDPPAAGSTSDSTSTPDVPGSTDQTDPTVPVQPVQPVPTAPPTPEAERAARPAAQQQFQSSSTRTLSEKTKAEEKRRSCTGGRQLASSGMLNLRRATIAGEHTRSGTVLWLGVGAAAAALALLWWRFRDRLRGGGRKGLIDLLGATVAICTGVAALAAQFVPGVGVRDTPPPELTMAVTQVHARVQHGSYANAVRESVPRALDRLEIGNVVWLQLGLKGFKDERLVLQWAEYNLDTGGALLPDTEGRRALAIEHDNETRFEPVWVGYPRSGRFQVQLRVLQDGQVQGMARTGEMRGTQYRYGCRASRT
jgi:hypothetical protein